MSRGQRKMDRGCDAEAKSATKVCHPGRSPTPPEPQTRTINQRLIFFSLPSYTFCSRFADACRLVQQLIQLKALYVPEQSFTSYTGKWWSQCSPAHLFPRKKNQREENISTVWKTEIMAALTIYWPLAYLHDVYFISVCGASKR